MGCCAISRVYVGRAEVALSGQVDVDLQYCVVCCEARPVGHPARLIMACCPKLLCRYCLTEWQRQQVKMGRTTMRCPVCRADLEAQMKWRPGWKPRMEADLEYRELVELHRGHSGG